MPKCFKSLIIVESKKKSKIVLALLTNAISYQQKIAFPLLLLA